MKFKYDNEIENLEHLVSRMVRVAHGHKMVTGKSAEEHKKFYEEHIGVFWEAFEVIGMDGLKALDNIESLKKKHRDKKKEEFQLQQKESE